MEKVLFVTNKLFVDITQMEGGVRLCTEDYIRLLKCKYDVVIFPLTFNKSLVYRLKFKLGIDVFEDYNEADYKIKLLETIEANRIAKVFINLSSTSRISDVIRKSLGERIKIIFCSHGIEAGDFLHQSVRFADQMGAVKNFTSSWRLGRIMQKELEFRLNNFDLVLTVSEIEASIENWLGSKNVILVPRVYTPDFLDWKPVMGRLGFLGDVSHYPNYYGLLILCKALNKYYDASIQIRVVGKLCDNLEMLTSTYSFVTALGYLDKEDIITEVSSWMFYLNPVFYFSKGVSTKLAKGMDWGLPILSTIQGNRGYVFGKGKVNTCSSSDNMVEVIHERLKDPNLLLTDKRNVEIAVEGFKSYEKLMEQISPVLDAL